MVNTSGVAPIHGGFYGNIFGAALANDGFCRSIFTEAPFARQAYGDFDHFNGAVGYKEAKFVRAFMRRKQEC